MNNKTDLSLILATIFCILTDITVFVAPFLVPDEYFQTVTAIAFLVVAVVTPPTMRMWAMRDL